MHWLGHGWQKLNIWAVRSSMVFWSPRVSHSQLMPSVSKFSFTRSSNVRNYRNTVMVHKGVVHYIFQFLLYLIKIWWRCIAKELHEKGSFRLELNEKLYSNQMGEVRSFLYEGKFGFLSSGSCFTSCPVLNGEPEEDTEYKKTFYLRMKDCRVKKIFDLLSFSFSLIQDIKISRAWELF